MKPSRPKPAPREEWASQLSEGLDGMGLTLSASQQQRLIDYLALLFKWNKAYNLTAVRDPRHMVSRQLLDSLSILPWVRGPRVLDVGTGPGLPGIPLAVALPGIEFVLLDANGKKTRFVQQAIVELGLDNVSVLQERVEAMVDARGFDTITSRAFADLHRMLALTAHLHAPGGQWAAMKASLEEFDPAQLGAGLDWRVEALQVPGEAGRRNLVLVYPAGESTHGQDRQGRL
jgi:16S rRNA (guanine527-N7)-methyltransferase